MKVVISTSLGTHRRDVETFEDVLELMQLIKGRLRFHDNDWRGA